MRLCRSKQRRLIFEICFARVSRVQCFYHFISTYFLSQRFLKKVQDDFKAEEVGRLVLYIDGRNPGSKLATPEQISKALRNQVTSDDFQRFIKNVRPSVSGRVERNMDPETKYILEAALNFQGSEEDLDETLAGLTKFFEALNVLPQKPVIVLGK